MNIHKKFKNIFMKVSPVKINVNKQIPQNNKSKTLLQIRKTPVKDALTVLGYTSLPIVIYEGVSQIRSYIKRKKNKSINISV